MEIIIQANHHSPQHARRYALRSNTMRSKIVRSLLALIVGLASANVVSAATDIVMRQIPVESNPGRPSISADGRYVAYIGGKQIYIYDLEKNTAEQASVGLNGQTSTNSICSNPRMSTGGRHVVFICSNAAEMGAANYGGDIATFI